MSNVSNYIPTDNTFGISQFLNDVGQQGLQKSGTTQKTTGVDQPTGSGAIAGTQSAPDPASAGALTAMMASIASIMPKMTGDQLDTLVTSLTTKMKDTMDATEKDDINNQQAKKEAAIKQKSDKLKEAEQKIKDAMAAQHSSNIFDKIKLAFEYIGAVLAMVAGIIAIATAPLTGPAGVVAGALLITSGIAMLTLAVDDTVAQATAKDGQPGMGMFGLMIKGIAKAEGKSDDEANSMAQKGEMGFKIGLMAIAIITGVIGGIINPVGEAQEVEEIAMLPTEIEGLANDGDQIANLAEDGEELGTMANESEELGTMAGDTGKSVQDVAKLSDDADNLMLKAAKADKIVGIVNASQNLISAGGQIGSSVEEYKATDDQADAKRAQADAKKFEAMGKFLDDMIDMAISRLKNNGDRFNQMLDSMTDAMKDRADTMSHAKFRG